MGEHVEVPWELGGCSGRMVKPVGFYGGDGFIADVDTLANAEFIVRACNAHDELVAALKELHALVWGECPSLLNEDSGGSAHLDAQIRAAIAKAGTT